MLRCTRFSKYVLKIQNYSIETDNENAVVKWLYTKYIYLKYLHIRFRVKNLYFDERS